MLEAKQLRLLPALAGCLTLALAPDAVSEDRFSLTFGAEYTSGDYGASKSTDILYVPVTGTLETGRNAFKLTVPYLRVTAPAGGVIVGTDHMGRPIRRGGRAQRATESGLGDVEASYGRTLIEDIGSGTRVDAVVGVKFGTADETRGLGTGENDYSAQLDLYQGLGSFTLVATLGYKVFGDPPGTDFDNIGFAALGASHRYGKTGSFGFVYGYRQAATVASDPQRELKLYVRGDAGRNRGLLAYVLKGNGSASPDFGLGLLFTREF